MIAASRRARLAGLHLSLAGRCLREGASGEQGCNQSGEELVHIGISSKELKMSVQIGLTDLVT